MRRYSITLHPHNYSLAAGDDYLALVASALVANGTGLEREGWVIAPGGHYKAARERLGEEYGAIYQRVTANRSDELIAVLRSVMIDGEEWDERMHSLGSSVARVETMTAVAQRRHHEYEHIEPYLRVWALGVAERIEIEHSGGRVRYLLS
jgi:hypothetical protein